MIGPPSELASDVVTIITHLSGKILWKIENLYHDINSESSKEEKFWAIKSIAEANKEPVQTLRDFFIQKGDEVKFIEIIEGVAKASSVKFEIASIDVRAVKDASFKEDINSKLARYFYAVDIVFHVAAMARIQPSFEYPKEYEITIIARKYQNIKVKKYPFVWNIIQVYSLSFFRARVIFNYRLRLTYNIAVFLK